MGKKKTVNRLSDLSIHEVSLVKRGANKRKFLLYKTEDREELMKAFLDQILKSGLTDEKQIDEKINEVFPESLIEKGEKRDNFISAVKGTMRLVNTLKGDLPEEKITELMTLLSGNVEKTVKTPTATTSKDGTVTTEPTVTTPEGIVSKEGKVKTPVTEKTPEEILKAHDTLMKKNEDLEKIIKDEREIRLKKEFADKAAAFKNIPGEKADLAHVMKTASETMDKETYDKFEGLLKGADAALKESALLKEAGTTGGSDAGADAWDKIEKAAVEMRKADPKLSNAQAIDKVMKEQPSLYEEYKAQREVA